MKGRRVWGRQVMELFQRIATERRAGKRALWLDAELKGFGLKVEPSGVMTWIVEYRPGAGGRGTANAIQSASLRRPMILRYAPCAA